MSKRVSDSTAQPVKAPGSMRRSVSGRMTSLQAAFVKAPAAISTTGAPSSVSGRTRRSPLPCQPVTVAVPLFTVKVNSAASFWAAHWA